MNERPEDVAAASGRVRVTSRPIAAAALADAVRRAGAGAVATFEGVVRDHHQGKAVSHLEYEAYAPMAAEVIGEIVARARERWEVAEIAVSHRTGRLDVGEVAVAIAVSAAHRDPAFDALRYIIDSLKQKAPIWKRETGPDGSFWIEGPDHVPAGE